MRPTKAIALAIALLIPSALFAQTSGRVVGHIVDNTNAPMPEGMVTVTGPTLPGAQSTASDANGNFRFLSQPPGDYHVKAEIAGFKTVDQTGIHVGLDHTATVSFTLEVA